VFAINTCTFILDTLLPLLRYWYRTNRPNRICINVQKTELRVLTVTEDSCYSICSLEHRHSCLHLPSMTSTMTSSRFFLREDIKTTDIKKNQTLWLPKPNYHFTRWRHIHLNELLVSYFEPNIFLTLQPHADYDVLIHEFSRTHATTHHTR
jgi:hypothetical protein